MDNNRRIAKAIVDELLNADVSAFERTISDAENTVYYALAKASSEALTIGGNEQQQKNCPVCSGTGRIDIRLGPATCLYCNGTGNSD